MTNFHIVIFSAVVEKEESTQKRGEDPSQCYPGVEGNMLNMSSESSYSTRAIFLKLMHNLSVVLLSTCKGGSLLQEAEEELLQSVIQNLTAARSKKQGMILKCFYLDTVYYFIMQCKPNLKYESRNGHISFLSMVLSHSRVQTLNIDR
jgi:hypothetical protein